MSGYLYMSKEAYDKLKADLYKLKTVNRPDISQKISEARDFGDLKENAEYHAAKEAMAMLESKISHMEETLRRARVVDPKTITNNHVGIYTKVKMKDLKRNLEVQYTIVSQEEADFKQYKISVTSPVAKALLGKKVGETVDVKVPAGVMQYEILDIEVAI